ncbi:MAG: response regulator, partial [Lachnospiraceae bacterium]|nr:response regulator [Lachnospiraceae bacterium]
QDLIHMELSGRYLLNLINDTLDVNKIESGKLELNPVVCDGRTVFNNVVTLLKPQLVEKNIEFSIEAENLPFNTLYIDVGRVEQIVMNVLGNAIKFTPEGGKIRFKMENISVGNGVILDRVSIEDNGVGMSEEFIPHLFEPFSQEHGGSTTSYQGTGLGMAITKEIIELMGGEISVESIVGKGTKFVFTLPLPIATEEQKAAWKAAQRMDSAAKTLKGKRVLLCEDHPLNTTIATRLMAKKGILVDHAENGKVGVEMFRASALNYYDTVLMDIRMPEMDGIEATRAIRRLNRRDAKRVPIIAMTANAFHEDEKQALDAGMDAHLAKPIDTGKLYDTLEYYMQAEHPYIRKKILVVDDIPLNRTVIIESIKADYDTLEAENGNEAMNILRNTAGIDAVITDIQMPHMDGKELIRQIRADRDFNHIAILANTQYGDAEQEEELLSIGADDFLYKPTKPRIIKFRLDNILKD